MTIWDFASEHWFVAIILTLIVVNGVSWTLGLLFRLAWLDADGDWPPQTAAGGRVKGNPMEADGWAVIEDVGIDVRSVSPTRRAAIVNWLVTRGDRMVWPKTTDKEIEQMWAEARGAAEVIPVKVSAAKGTA